MKIVRDIQYQLALVENGQIADVIAEQLGPYSFITNLEAFTVAELAQFNILPIEYVNWTFDPSATTSSDEATVDIQTDKIVATFVLTPLSDTDLLAMAKESKKQEILNQFNVVPTLGFYCSSVGIKMDCKRTDIDNMRTLIEYYDGRQELINSYPEGDAKTAAQTALDADKANISIMDFDNVQHSNITYLQIKSILNDLMGYGLWMYTRKWQCLSLLDSATTVDQVKAILW